MAIRIPILTSFDPKGLKQANAAFANLQSSMSSLGRNFAVVGAGIAASTALLGKAVMSASNFEAEFEGVNQVFKDAAGSVQAFAETAAATAGLSATEALRAAKTFGLFATGAGLSVQEASKFSTTLVQLAGDLGSFNDLPTADALAAIQSGLMGQAEPLRVFGVFLDDLSLKNELFEMTGQKVTGTLTSQQKMIAAYSQILKDTTVQQGDFVKYQETLGNQLKIVDKEFQNLVRDIGMMLIPVIAEAMPIIRQMAVEIGEKLKNAIGSIDWRATIQAVVDFTTFLVVNAETIAKVVAAIFVLNTAFKLMAVASGLTTVAIKLQTWFTAQLATGMTIATVATNILSAAMRLIPFVAIASGLALIVNGIMNIGNEASKSEHNVRILNGQITTGASEAPSNASKYIKVAGGFKLIESAADSAALAVEAFNKPSDSESRNRRNALRDQNRQLGLIGSNGSTFTMPDFSSLLSGSSAGAGAGQAAGDAAQAVADSVASTPTGLQAWLDNAANDAKKVRKRMQLIGAGLSAAVADSILASSDPIQAANETLSMIASGGTEAINTLNKAFRRSEAGQALAAQRAEERAAKEKARLERQRAALQSFNDAVKQLYGQIKDSIMSAFKLPDLGNSINSITRNMQKLLAKTRSFATNIAQLGQMGLNSTLLQQVIAAGPMAGAQLASAIVSGGSSFVAQLNAGFAEMGSLAGSIASTGTQSAFGNAQTVNNYSIAVTGGLATSADVGAQVVKAIRTYERQSGSGWRA
jgi:hypothetical protein